MTPDETPQTDAAPDTAPPEAGAAQTPQPSAAEEPGSAPGAAPGEAAAGETAPPSAPEQTPEASAQASAAASEAPAGDAGEGSAGEGSGSAIADALGAEFFDNLEATLAEIPMRVGAELGRATLPLAQAVDLGPGVVIELDRAADDPIDLCINGQRFATGQLLLVEENEWAIRIERIFPVDPAVGYASRQGGFTA
jgi:flagellar motor switch protein FliN/FliY